MNPSPSKPEWLKKFSGSTNVSSNFLTGNPEKRENVSTLRPEQESLYNQLIGAGQGAGAGGAFGTAADYYRNLLSDENADYNAFSAPMLRQYNQDIIPGISEQFAGMGAGGLSSSGFRNAQVQGATDLAERLGALRASLRQAGAQGLQNIGQTGLQNFSQNMITEHATPGFLSTVAPLVGTALGAFAGPIGAAAGNAIGSAIGNSGGIQPGGISSGSPAPAFQPGGISASSNWLTPNTGNRVGANTSPYGGGIGPRASPTSGMQMANNLQSQRGF